MDQLHGHKIARQSVHFKQQTPATLLRNLFFRDIHPTKELFRPELRAINHNTDQQGDKEIILKRNEEYDEVATEFLEDIIVYLKFNLRDPACEDLCNHYKEFVITHAVEFHARSEPLSANLINFEPFMMYLEEKIWHLRSNYFSDYYEHIQLKMNQLKSMLFCYEKKTSVLNDDFLLRDYIMMGDDENSGGEYKHCVRGYVLTHNGRDDMKGYCLDRIIQILHFEDGVLQRSKKRDDRDQLIYSFGYLYQYHPEYMGKVINPDPHYYLVGYGKRLMTFFDVNYRPNTSYEFHPDNALFLPVGFMEIDASKRMPIFLDSNLSGAWLEHLRRDLQDVEELSYLSTGQLMLKKKPTAARQSLWYVLDFNHFMSRSGHFDQVELPWFFVDSEYLVDMGVRFWGKRVYRHESTHYNFEPVDRNLILECRIRSFSSEEQYHDQYTHFPLTPAQERPLENGIVSQFRAFIPHLFDAFTPVDDKDLYAMRVIPELNRARTKRIVLPEENYGMSHYATVRIGPSNMFTDQYVPLSEEETRDYLSQYDHHYGTAL